jgi:hypothetical protein
LRITADRITARDRSGICKLLEDMSEIVIRFCLGGLIVSAFALISDLLKPKTFAGLFGAAPSVALASLALTVMRVSSKAASVEARSMIIGAVALLIYALSMSYVVLRFRARALPVSLSFLLIWLAAALGLWHGILGS